MADLPFTTGLDDRDFMRTIDRMESRTTNVSRNIAVALGFGTAVFAAKRAMRIIGDSLDEFGSKSRSNAREVEAIGAAFDRVRAKIGEDVIATGFLGDVGAAVQGAHGFGQKVGDALHDGVKAVFTSGGLYDLFVNGKLPKGTAAEKRQAAADEQNSRIGFDRTRRALDAKRELEYDFTVAEASSRGDSLGEAFNSIERQRDAATRKVQGMSIERKAREELIELINRTAEAREREAQSRAVEKEIDEGFARWEKEKDRLDRFEQEELQMKALELDTRGLAGGKGMREIEIAQKRLEYEQQILRVKQEDGLTDDQRNDRLNQLLTLQGNAEINMRAKFAREDRAKDSFRTVDAGTVADLDTANQIVAAVENPVTVAARESAAAAAKSAATQEKQLREQQGQSKLLESIDRSIRGGAGAVYQ